MADAGFIKVAQASELRTGEMMAVTIGDDQVLLSNIDGNFHAIDDVCSHAYACLSDGDINGEEAACPLHGGSFYTTDRASPSRKYFHDVQILGSNFELKFPDVPRKPRHRATSPPELTAYPGTAIRENTSRRGDYPRLHGHRATQCAVSLVPNVDHEEDEFYLVRHDLDEI